MAQFVEEPDLDFQHFQCCGDEDLYPFGCPRCSRLMVFCYECETLYGDLRRLNLTGWLVNHSDTSRPASLDPGRLVRTVKKLARL